MLYHMIFIYYESNPEKKPSSKDFYFVSNGRVKITIMRINPYSFSGICGERCNDLHIDMDFQKTEAGRKLIDEVFRPMASLRDSSITFF